MRAPRASLARERPARRFAPSMSGDEDFASARGEGARRAGGARVGGGDRAGDDAGDRRVNCAHRELTFVRSVLRSDDASTVLATLGFANGDARDQQLTELKIAKKNLRLLIGPILAESAVRENKSSLTGYSHLEAIGTDESGHLARAVVTSPAVFHNCRFTLLEHNPRLGCTKCGHFAKNSDPVGRSIVPSTK